MTLIHVNIAPPRDGYRAGMPDAFVLRPLTRQQIRQAYPLVRSHVPEVSEARWDAFARARTAAAGTVRKDGIMTLQNQTGYILGIFVYDVRDDLQAGRILSVAHTTIAELVGQQTLTEHLLEGMFTVARLHDCAAIDVQLPQSGPRASLNTIYQRAGFAFDRMHARQSLRGERPLAAAGSRA